MTLSKICLLVSSTQATIVFVVLLPKRPHVLLRDCGSSHALTCYHPHTLNQCSGSISPTVFVVCFISIVGHIVSVGEHIAGFAATIVTLGIVDASCAVYLTSIWAVDAFYEGIYFLFEQWWRSSEWCFAFFFTILWFTVLSFLLIPFLTFSRHMVVVHPLDSKFKRTSVVIKVLLLVCSASGLVCLALTLLFKFVHREIPTDLCLPFVDPTHSVLTTSILTWVAAATHLVEIGVVITMCVILVLKVQKSSEAVRKSKSEGSAGLITQLVLLSVSNVLCWFPVDGIYLSIMFLPTYPLELTSTVVGLPINSIISPSVLSIFCIKNCVKSTAKSRL